MRPYCSFEELIPIFLPDTPETTFDCDRRWNTTESEDSFTDHTRRIHDPWHGLLTIIALQSSIKSFINVLKNLREPIRCNSKRNSMWQITQTPIFIQQRWPAACFVRLGTGIPIRGQLFCIMGPELSGNQLRVYFGIFSDSWYHAPNKFSGWIESLLLSNKMIDFKYQTKQE